MWRPPPSPPRMLLWTGVAGGRMSGAGVRVGWRETSREQQEGLVEQQVGRWPTGLVLPVTLKMDVASVLRVKPEARITSICYVFTS